MISTLTTVLAAHAITRETTGLEHLLEAFVARKLFMLDETIAPSTLPVRSARHSLHGQP